MAGSISARRPTAELLGPSVLDRQLSIVRCPADGRRRGAAPTVAAVRFSTQLRGRAALSETFVSCYRGFRHHYTAHMSTGLGDASA